jgi:hypothetical protein
MTKFDIREFFKVLNEYPWTAICVALFIIAVLNGIAEIIVSCKRKS